MTTATAAPVYPSREADAARLAKVGMSDEIASRALDYLTALNESDARLCIAQQSPFERHRFFEVDDQPRNVKFVRLVARDAHGGNGRSVAAFIEKATGYVLKADGWKRPAAGVRYSLATDEGRDKICAVAEPHGGHLYAR